METDQKWVGIHVMLGIIHLVMGVVVLGDPYFQDFIAESEKTIVVTYPNITTSSNPSKYSAALNERGGDENTHFKLSPITIHATVSVITAFSHLVSAWVYRKDGGVCIQEPNYVRWGEYAITATFMSISGMVSLGFTDAYVLGGVVLVGIGVQLCGFFMEATKGLTIKLKDFKNPQSLWPFFFLLGCLMQVSITLPITAWTATSNRVFGIYWAWAIYVIYYLLFPLNAVFDVIYVPPDVNSKGEKITDFKAEKRTAFSLTDKRYVILSFCSKISLYWITVASLIYNMTEGDERDSWYAVVFVACIVPALLTVFWLTWSVRESLEISKKYGRAGKKPLLFEDRAGDDNGGRFVMPGLSQISNLVF